MSIAVKTQKETASLPFPGAKRSAGLAQLLVISSLLLLSCYQIAMPTAKPADAPVSEFSAGRAIEYIQAIATDPHPIGSIEHDRVRDYLVQQLSALGLNPEIQSTSVVRKGRDSQILAGSVQNVIARLQGTGTTRAILFAGHYDSVVTGPGASDDGSAIATLLETMRVLKAGPPLKNDVIILFTDAEEVGLLGAQAFVDFNPAAKDVGLVFNFEARGNGGPSLMFETSANNGWLIPQLAKGDSSPMANSVFNEIYKSLPNDTDFTVFKGAGFPGLNFAYINGVNHYHTRIDSIQELDQRSLQQDGSYALTLARYFGNLELEPYRRPDAVYFNVFSVLVHYPAAWTLPLLAIAAAAFFITLGLGLKNGDLRLGGIFAGSLVFGVTLIASAAIVMIAWRVIVLIHPRYSTIFQGDLYHGISYVIALLALSVLIYLLVYGKIFAKTATWDLALGAQGWWLIAALLTGLYMPGVSYLFIWPLIFSVVGMGLNFILSPGRGLAKWRFAAVAITAIPAILLFVPICYLLFEALSFNLFFAVVLMSTFLLGLLLPNLLDFIRVATWMKAAGLALVAFTFLAVGAFTNGFDGSHPDPDSLFYSINTDIGQAAWASFDQKPDEWTSQFLQARTDKTSSGEFVPRGYEKSILKGQAPLVPFPPPVAVLMDETKSGASRTLHLRVTSPRGAPVMLLSLQKDLVVKSSSVNGKQVPASGAGWALRYYNVPKDGIELTLELDSAGQASVQATDVSYSISSSALNGHQGRPEDTMLDILPFSDVTMVRRSFTF